VATRDTHVPLPRRRDDAQSGGRRDVGRIAVCWWGWGWSTSPQRGMPTSLLGSRTFLDRAPAPYVPFANTHGPTWTWI
jgi:hypothetical protein